MTQKQTLHLFRRGGGKLKRGKGDSFTHDMPKGKNRTREFLGRF